MLDFDRDRLFSALTYAVFALFLLTGVVSMRHRPRMRRAAVILYLAILAGVVAWIAVWLIHGGV